MDLAAAGEAAKLTGAAIRESFAGHSPQTAAANAEFHFFKTLSDVLSPLEGRPKVTTGPSGVTGGTRVSTAVMARVAGLSPGATATLSVIAPMLKDVLASPAWQLSKARQKLALAQAIRGGNPMQARQILGVIAKATPALAQDLDLEP